MTEEDKKQNLDGAAKVVLEAWTNSKSAVVGLQEYCWGKNMIFEWDFYFDALGQAIKLSVQAGPDNA